MLPKNSTDHYIAAEYLLIIQPHQDLYDKIMRIKKLFSETYDCPTIQYLKPHITLIKFLQFEMTEQRFINKLQQIAETHAAFKVELKNFGSFPTHTIYINVETKNQIVELVKDLRQTQHLLKKDKDHKPHFITEPHLTIARRLLPWQYEKAWLQYQHTDFSGMFMTNELILLKKRIGTNAYQIAAKFPLLNKPIPTTIQTTLFI